MLESITPQELKIVEWLRNKSLTNYLSDFIERSDSHNRFITGIMGWHWEDEFKTLCELHSLECIRAPLNSRYDVMVNSNKVQCKFTSSSSRIDIRNKNKEENRRYKPCDFDFMAIKSNENIYIVPISSLLDKTLTQTKQSIKIEDILIYKDCYEQLQTTSTTK
jgi:hypothetical protein